MDFAKLYDLSHTFKRTALHVDPRDSDDPQLEALCVFLRDPRAHALPAHQREAAGRDVERLFLGELRLSAPLLFNFMKGASGSTAHDLIGTTFTSLLLVSDKTIGVLSGFSGWTTYPVEVYGKRGELIPGYHGLAVTGRCGPIDYTKSTPRVCEPPIPGGGRSRQWFGLCFDEKTWDGSDIFVPEGTHMNVVVEAVKVALEKAKITNIEFEPLSECRNHRIRLELL
jgi:hypothetical protein